MAWLCKPIGLVNLQLHVALVSWFLPSCILASIPGILSLYMASRFGHFSRLFQFAAFERDTKLASIFRRSRGIPPTAQFQGSCPGHDMTESYTHWMLEQFQWFFYFAFIIGGIKSGPQSEFVGHA